MEAIVSGSSTVVKLGQFINALLGICVIFSFIIVSGSSTVVKFRQS